MIKLKQNLVALLLGASLFNSCQVNDYSECYSLLARDEGTSYLECEAKLRRKNCPDRLELQDWFDCRREQTYLSAQAAREYFELK